jgi:hypothetical protein
MWWIAFTAFDLYIGLVILEALIPSLPAEKLPRARMARKGVLGSIGTLAIVFVALLVRRWSAPH